MSEDNEFKEGYIIRNNQVINVADPEVKKKADQYLHICEQIDSLSEIKDGLRKDLMDLIPVKSSLNYKGRNFAVNKSSELRFDSGKFKKENPQIYEMYRVHYPEKTTLRVTKSKWEPSDTDLELLCD